MPNANNIQSSAVGAHYAAVGTSFPETVQPVVWTGFTDFPIMDGEEGVVIVPKREVREIMLLGGKLPRYTYVLRDCIEAIIIVLAESGKDALKLTHGWEEGSGGELVCAFRGLQTGIAVGIELPLGIIRAYNAMPASDEDFKFCVKDIAAPKVNLVLNEDDEGRSSEWDFFPEA